MRPFLETVQGPTITLVITTQPTAKTTSDVNIFDTTYARTVSVMTGEFQNWMESEIGLNTVEKPDMTSK